MNAVSDNKFLKVMITTQRAKQIHKGARPRIQISSTRATRIALAEVESGLIGYEFITPRDPNLNSGREKRDVSGPDEKEVNRETTNQQSVERLLSVGGHSD